MIQFCLPSFTVSQSVNFFGGHMRTCLSRSLLVALSVVFSSCGGGGSSGSSSSGSSTNGPLAPPSSNLHSIQLGPIVGAAVTIFRADCKTSLFQTTTDTNGGYSINIQQLKNALGASLPALLCVESVGGKDVDPNDDGIRAAGEELSVLGKIRGYVATLDLLNSSGTRVNLFGNALADLLSQTDDVTIERIELLANQLSVPDINGDGKITMADITRYEMGSKSNGEQGLRDFYLRAIHEGNNSDRQYFVDTSALSLAAIRPTIVSNGKNTASLTLTPFSKGSTISYGFVLQKTLPSVYTSPLAVRANDIVYMQECVASNCYPLQVVQINPNATGAAALSDTGGVDLTQYFASQQARNDVLARIQSTNASISAANAEIAQKTQQIAGLNGQVSSLASQNATLQTELRQLQQ